jgi:hypothetical protein
MQVHGPAHLHGAQPVGGPHAQRPAAAPPRAEPLDQRDELQISTEGNFVAQARDLPEVRLERVQSLRAEIASGKYETAEKLDAALDRLLDEIG